MDIEDKLQILSGAAKYDVSCASSGSRRQNTPRGIGNAMRGGCCHSWSDDGRCISLLKVLMTNRCIYDCAYCVNRCSNPIPRAAFSVDDVVNLTMSFYKRNYIEGLFLSSGVERSPDYTMEHMTEVVRRLRVVEHFNGYIHLKALPGASPEIIRRAGCYADRLSVNIELPSEASLLRLAPQKAKHSILAPMRCIADEIQRHSDERKALRRPAARGAVGQSTQLIVSASPETDFHILQLAERLYQRYRLKRVYYSAYVPVNDDTRLPAAAGPDMTREHRLYQADWLVRVYGFSSGEILDAAAPQLDPALDPKSTWALRHFDQFPVEINRADYETLLRVPGIGVRSAKRLVATRRIAPLRLDDLRPLGVVMKRARHFVTCQGAFSGSVRATPEAIRPLLMAGAPGDEPLSPLLAQPELFGEL